MDQNFNNNDLNNSNQVNRNVKNKGFKSKYKFILIFGGLLLVLIMALIMFLSFGNNKTNSTSNDKKDNSVLKKCNNKIDTEYKLIFDTVGGNVIESIIVKYDSVSNENLPTPIRDNSIFEGWYYDNSYNKKVETNEIKNIFVIEKKDSQDCIIGYEDIILYAKWKESNEISNNELSDDELYTKLNELMKQKGYNEYAIKVINSFIKDYQKLFSNNEIYNLFSNVTKIVLNPYDPKQPNLSHTDRAYNASGSIIVNCFEGELDNDKNWDGLKWLLTHEIIHSLGNFPSEQTEGSYETSIWTRNSLLEEGLADSIAHFVKGTDHNNKFAIKKQDDFKMYRVDSNYKVLENDEVNHTYTISGNVISVFKYIGCYDEIIHANINNSFKDLKTCMSNNVKNGNIYFDKLFENINKIYLYIGYPNQFYSKTELIERYKYYNDSKLKEFIENNNLNDLLIEYANLSSEIINNKIDNTYSICDFYKNNVIFYNLDNNGYKTNLNCQ